MNMDTFTKNWKTSLFGLLMLGFLGYKFYLDPNSLGINDILMMLGGAGFFFTADHKNEPPPTKPTE